MRDGLAVLNSNRTLDDILDFTGSDQQLGKPAASDLATTAGQMAPGTWVELDTIGFGLHVEIFRRPIDVLL